jgi:hypothetical protein
MSGVHGSTVAGATLATGAVAGKAAHALMPFTGVAVGIYLVFAVGLIVGGFVLRRLGANRA